MTFAKLIACAGFAAAVLASAPVAMAATNLALSSEGASFVAGSSFIGIGGYSQPIAEANLLTNTPADAFPYDHDTRYIFAGGQGSTQTLEIDLGAVENVASFAATFGATDRTAQGLTVSYSTDGISFTTIANAGVLNGAGDEYTVSGFAPVSAEYVIYNFGGPSSQYGYGGTGISQLFATAVPEPATWAMMLLGLGAIGGLLRLNARTGRKFAGISSAAA